MIPADVASRMQVSADASLRPVAPSQELSDRLSDLVAGQKVMAEIQSMLPNGTYRALINQRSVTLALPFSAKSGDSLELQVTESDGKLALAVVSRSGEDSGQTVRDSASATLSRTGQLISSLFSAPREARSGPLALPLNDGQPIASKPPVTAQDILPQLKQAITQSGMFYESHQAEWVEGRLASSALLQEPQGKLSSPAAFAAAASDESVATSHLKAPLQTGATESGVKAAVVANNEPAAAPRSEPGVVAAPGAGTEASKSSAAAPASQAPGQIVAPQAQPIVQQQLDALATQNFVWQGQVWPGQEMRWEIDEDAARRGTNDNEPAGQWVTRLRLVLPNLGEVDARIRLDGNQVTLSMSAGKSDTRTLIRSSALSLRSQFDEAGLTLASMGVEAIDESRTDGQPGL